MNKKFSELQNTLEFVDWYIGRGMWVVPVQLGQKRPVLEAWQELRIGRELVPRYFTSAPMNIGIILGAPWNLTDIDLDCREALAAWIEFGPDTAFIFGRRSKPASHWFYRSDPALRSFRFVDPVAKPGDKACLLEIRSLKSDGTIGLQTIAPGSRHESGETISFEVGMDKEPANVDAPELLRAARWTAACCILGRHAPPDGSRHLFFLALAGALAHAQWPLLDATRIVRGVYRVLWGSGAHLDKAEGEVESTYRRYDDGHEITGLPHLKSVLDPRVFSTALKWLGLGGSRKAKSAPAQSAPPPAAPPPKPPPVPQKLSVLRDKVITMPDQLIQHLLIRPGVTLIVGSPRAGKTVLAVQMIMSLAAGQDLFGWYHLTQTNTMIVEQDDKQGEASLKDFELKCRMGIPGNPCHYVTDTEFVLGPTLNTWLKEQIRTFSLGVIVLDSYTSFRGVRGKDGDIVKAEAGDFALLGELARETGVAIIVIHHDSKTSAHLDWSSRAAGSYAVGAATDTLIFCSRFPELTETDGERLVRVRGRKLPGLEMVLRFAEPTLDYDWLGQGGASTMYPEIRQLARHFGKRTFSAKDVTDDLGWARATAYRVLLRLTSSSVLNKTGSSWEWNPQSDFWRNLR